MYIPGQLSLGVSEGGLGDLKSDNKESSGLGVGRNSLRFGISLEVK